MWLYGFYGWKITLWSITLISAVQHLHFTHNFCPTIFTKFPPFFNPKYYIPGLPRRNLNRWLKPIQCSPSKPMFEVKLQQTNNPHYKEEILVAKWTIVYVQCQISHPLRSSIVIWLSPVLSSLLNAWPMIFFLALLIGGWKNKFTE